MKKQPNKDKSNSDKLPGQRINPKPLLKTFAPVPNWLLCRPEVSFGAKSMYGRLVQFADENGVAWPSQQLLAQELGIKPRQAQTYIQELVRIPLIATKLEGMPASNKYYFLFHPWMEEAYTEDNTQHNLDQPQDTQSSAQQDTQSSAQQDTQSSAQQDTQSSAHNKNKEKNKEKNTHREEKESVCVSPSQVSAYSKEEWLRYTEGQKNVDSPSALANSLAKSKENDHLMRRFLDSLHQQERKQALEQEAQKQKSLELQQQRLSLISSILSNGEPFSDSDRSLLTQLGYCFQQNTH